MTPGRLLHVAIDVPPWHLTSWAAMPKGRIDKNQCMRHPCAGEESTARSKIRSQLIVSGEEVLGQDASLPDGRHETGISRPAGE